MSYVSDLLVECLHAQGMNKPLAEKTISVLMAVNWDGRNPDTWELCAKVYTLRGQTMAIAISARLGITRETVYRLVKRHGIRRRKALRVA